MSIDTWWVALGAWTITGLLAAIAFGRVARNNDDQEQDAVFGVCMPVSDTPNVRHFRRQKRKVTADAVTPHQATRDTTKRRAS